MNKIKMSYKGLELEVNPSSLEVSMSKSIAERQIPFRFTKANEIAFEPTVIKGKGRISAENAEKEIFRLERVFKSKGSAYLFAPNVTPMKAFFKALSMQTDSRDGSVCYTFEFVEDDSGKKSLYDFGYVLAMEGDNLFTIANRTGVKPEELFECNDYKDLFSVKSGDKVWLS